MSITYPPRKTRSRAAKIVLIPAITLGLIGGPVALAAPATASTSDRGCTVSPLRPIEQNRTNRVDFRISVRCNNNKAVQIRQQRYEERGRNDRFLGRSTFWQSFGRGNSSVTIHSYDRVPNRPGHEEVYQLVSFRVRLGNSNQWSNWTRWEMSQVARIP